MCWSWRRKRRAPSATTSSAPSTSSSGSSSEERGVAARALEALDISLDAVRARGGRDHRRRQDDRNGITTVHAPSQEGPRAVAARGAQAPVTTTSAPSTSSSESCARDEGVGAQVLVRLGSRSRAHPRAGPRVARGRWSEDRRRRTRALKRHDRASRRTARAAGTAWWTTFGSRPWRPPTTPILTVDAIRGRRDLLPVVFRSRSARRPRPASKQVDRGRTG